MTTSQPMQMPSKYEESLLIKYIKNKEYRMAFIAPMYNFYSPT